MDVVDGAPNTSKYKKSALGKGIFIFIFILVYSNSSTLDGYYPPSRLGSNFYISILP